MRSLTLHAHIWIQTHITLITRATQSRQDSVKLVFKRKSCAKNLVIFPGAFCYNMEIYTHIVLLQIKPKNDTRTHQITHAQM